MMEMGRGRGVSCLSPHTWPGDRQWRMQHHSRAQSGSLYSDWTPWPDGNADCIQRERSARQAEMTRQRDGGNTNLVAERKIGMEVYCQSLYSKWQFVWQCSNPMCHLVRKFEKRIMQCVVHHVEWPWKIINFNDRGSLGQSRCQSSEEVQML